jgi:hypothetical protein
MVFYDMFIPTALKISPNRIDGGGVWGIPSSFPRRNAFAWPMF